MISGCPKYSLKKKKHSNQCHLQTNALPVVIEDQDKRFPSPFEVKAVTAI